MRAKRILRATMTLLAILLSITLLVAAGCSPASPSDRVADAGIITGTLAFPSDYLPAQVVCAEDVNARGTRHCVDVEESLEGRQYELRVPPGTYFVYATLKIRKGDVTPDYRAYYNDFVTCGITASCDVVNKHQRLIPVAVGVNSKIEGVDPIDWYDRQVKQQVTPPATVKPLELPPSPTPARGDTYCQKFEASQPDLPSFAQVPPNELEAAAIARILKPAGNGSAQQLLERANLDSLPPRVAWFYLPFRGYEQANAEESNRRAASNLLRYVGFNTGIGNPYTDFLSRHVPVDAILTRLFLIAKDIFPKSHGDQEQMIAFGAVEILRSGGINSEAREAWREAVLVMAQRYSSGATALSDVQHCFMFAVNKKPDAAIDYLIALQNPMAGLEPSYRRVLMENYRRYQNEAILYPSMTFLEYALKR